jgi:hypothetical protein
MTINFIPNDPSAGQPAMRSITPAANRASGRVRFVPGPMPAQANYAPGTPQFVAWQCRQTALTTLDVYESVCGPLIGWQGSGSKKNLAVIHDDPTPDLNAYYNRASISFFHFPVGATLVYSGASTDVVAHEAGHAILDSLRPDLWDVTMMEPAAFHEGFGDCIAVMMALSDKETRQKVLGTGSTISKANFAEATAEELSGAIRAVAGPNHNASLPRRAFNSFLWKLPQTLPANGPPNVLINEVHSLGQLASGVYYDLIANIFAANATKTEVTLWNACKKATNLAVDAVRRAPIRPRFFETWGRTMMVIDNAAGGANAAHIRAAFARHGITVGTTGFLTPQATLGNTGIKAASGAGMLTDTAKRGMRSLLGVAPGTSLAMRRVDIGEQAVAEVTAEKPVDLTGLAEKLAGVVARVPQPAFVGEVEGGLAVLGAVQSDFIYSSEVRDFVATLVRKSAIDLGGSKKKGKGSGFLGRDNVTTHAIERQGRNKVLKRVAFACGCGCARRRGGRP